MHNLDETSGCDEIKELYYVLKKYGGKMECLNEAIESHYHELGLNIHEIYDKTDEIFRYMFDNVRDILKFMGKPITRQNVMIVNNELYRALKSETHFTRFLTGAVLRVHIIKTKKEENEK